MEDIIKIIKSPEDSGVQLKGVNKTIQNEAKEQKKDFLVCCQVHQVQIYQVIFQQKRMIRAGEGFIRAGYRSSIKNKDC